MSILSGSFVDLARAKMSWASQRQSVIAQNIANASTPDFTPSDMNEKAFRVFLRRETAAAQNSQSGSGLRGSFATRGSSGGIIETKADGETNPNGNGVSLERQMMKAAENNMEYQQAASLYRKAITMWRTALGGRGG